MKAFVLTLLFVLAPAVLRGQGKLSGESNVMVYPDGSTITTSDVIGNTGEPNLHPKCAKLECPDGSVEWICDCPKCSLKCSPPIVNDFASADDPDCKLNHEDPFYVDGKPKWCAKQDNGAPPAMADDASRHKI